MANTLGRLYRDCPDLQDNDLENVTVLLFADLNGDTKRMTVKQLKKLLDLVEEDK